MTVTHSQLPARLLPLVPAPGLCLLYKRKEGRKGGMGGTTYLAKGLLTTGVYRYVRGHWRLTKTY